MAGAGNYGFRLYPQNPTYGMNHLISVVEGLEQMLSGWEGDLAETQKDLAIQKELASAPFDQQEVLKEKRSRYREIMDELNPPKEQQNVSEEDVQYQTRGDNSDVEDYERTVLRGVSASEPGNDGRRSADESGPGVGRKDAGTAWERLGEGKRNQVINQVDSYTYLSDEADLLLRVYKDGDVSDPAVREEAVAKMAEKFYTSMQENRVLLENDPRFKWLGDMMGLLIQDVEAIENGTFTGMDDEELYQLRNERLSDREVLATAASAVNPADLDEAERNALDIYQRKPDKFRLMQDKRLELGKLYKQQKFGPNVDRQAAAQALEKMKHMDEALAEAKAMWDALKNSTWKDTGTPFA